MRGGGRPRLRRAGLRRRPAGDDARAAASCSSRWSWRATSHVVVVDPRVHARDRAGLPGVGRAGRAEQRPGRVRTVRRGASRGRAGQRPRAGGRARGRVGSVDSAPTSSGCWGAGAAGRERLVLLGRRRRVPTRLRAWLHACATSSTCRRLRVRCCAGGSGPRPGRQTTDVLRRGVQAGRSATLLATLPARLLQKLLVLLLPHALAALLDQGAHGGQRRYQQRGRSGTSAGARRGAGATRAPGKVRSRSSGVV